MISEIVASLIAFSIGSNNTSNAFGISVGCRLIKFRTAVILIGIFVTLGSLTQRRVMETVGKLSVINSRMVFIVLAISALMIVLSNWKKLPVSSHQAIIGSIVGAGIATNTAKLGLLLSIVFSWVVSPVGALILAIFIYLVLERVFSKLPVFAVDRILYVSLIGSGILVAYNTGANELAAALAPLVASKLMSPFEASILGSISLFAGAVLLSSGVLETVGKGIVSLDPLSGFCAQSSAGLSVLLFTLLGMPVSTTYCLIGGIVGVGLLKGVHSVRFELIRKVLLTWVTTPFAAFILSYVAIKLFFLM